MVLRECKMEVDKKFNNISIFNFNESWVNVEFDDPLSKNALSENMINELNNFFDQASRDTATHEIFSTCKMNEDFNE